MNIQPCYTQADVKAAYHLRYNWIGWPTESILPPQPAQEFFRDFSADLEGDGIRLLEHQWSPTGIKMVTSVLPTVSPTLFTSRMKGRLNYSLRLDATPVKFKRNFAMKTVGENTGAIVGKYIEAQVENAEFADPRFARFLEQFSYSDESVDFTEPSATTRGQYWYDLHLVLVTRNRWRMVDEVELRTVFDGCKRIAKVKGHKIAWLAVMPDHLHVGLRGNIDHAPEEIALGFMNNLCHLLGRDAVWQRSYYVGSFGAYDMGAIRRACSNPSGPVMGSNG